MQLLFYTYYRPCCLKIPVTANRDCEVQVQIYDPSMPDCFLTRRKRIFKRGITEVFYIPMPLTGNCIVAAIFENDEINNAPESFTVHTDRMKLLSLPSQMDVYRMKDPKVKEWMRFAQRFFYNASILPCHNDKYYVSDNENFKIDYVEKILNEDGTENITPMRINKYTGIIEISKAKIVPMTYPGRMCMGGHEYSHLFRNQDINDELEADLNGLEIYLSLGYPKYDAKETFYSTFYRDELDDDPVILERLKHIDSFIDQYQQLEFELL